MRLPKVHLLEALGRNHPKWTTNTLRYYQLKTEAMQFPRVLDIPPRETRTLVYFYI